MNNGEQLNTTAQKTTTIYIYNIYNTRNKIIVTIRVSKKTVEWEMGGN